MDGTGFQDMGAFRSLVAPLLHSFYLLLFIHSAVVNAARLFCLPFRNNTDRKKVAPIMTVQ